MRNIIAPLLAGLVIFASQAVLADEGTGIEGTGKLHAIKDDKVNLSHAPIKQIGWPAMTMDFKVAPGVDLSNLKADQNVTFRIDKGPDGMYQIISIK